MNTDLVVLVDERNIPIGTALKATVHTKNTPLHRGFSVFLFRNRSELLITRRAEGKTFAGVWTNSFCGHPAPEEKVEGAATRRAKDELGIAHIQIHTVIPYRYKYADAAGIVENEICPVILATTEESVMPNPQEVSEFKWVNWDEFFLDIQTNSETYSPWAKDEALLVSKYLHLHPLPQSHQGVYAQRP